MKVFEFDPATGLIGDLIEHRKIASWGGASLEFLAGEGETVPPYIKPVRKGAQFMCHRDGGVSRSTDDGIEFVSYRHQTKWIAFCVGCFSAGEGEEYWDWMILPSLDSYPVT